jgi:hypothetical protein
MIMCQELWTFLPIWETQTEQNAVRDALPSGGYNQIGGRHRVDGDYCQGVARLDGFGLYVERWKRVTDKEGKRVWEKTRQSITWVQQEEDIFLPGAWLCERRLGQYISRRVSSSSLLPTNQ